MFVSINHLTVQMAHAGEVSKRFDAVKSHLANSQGFLKFRLLKPHAADSRWLVYTEWESQEHYADWKASADFARMHSHQGEQHPDTATRHGSAPRALAIDAEVITYDVISEFS